MKFEKPPLTFDQQANLLLARGLVTEKSVLIARLEVVNYYRLSAYLYPFRESDDRLREGTTLDSIWRLYVFDRQLRLLTTDAIERVEVSVRTQLAYHLAHEHGTFAYLNPNKMPGLTSADHKKWIDELEIEMKRSTEPFISHFFHEYGDVHSMPPIWMIAEIMSFGKTLTFFRGVDRKVRQTVSRVFSVSDEVLLSWLIALNGVRNVCAHHGRLWNRELGYRPKIPRERKYPQWHKPVPITHERVFGVLTILRYLLRVAAPTSKWDTRFRSLISRYPEVPLRPMGFPDNWDSSPLWRIG
jgi:abortive infection bacteriophage resistance protein